LPLLAYRLYQLSEDDSLGAEPQITLNAVEGGAASAVPLATRPEGTRIAPSVSCGTALRHQSRHSGGIKIHREQQGPVSN
jgi:hypothetical protein